MSRFAVLGVHYAIFFVSVVGSMRAIIVVRPTTDVYITVIFVKMNSSYVVHGELFCPHLAHLLKTM